MTTEGGSSLASLADFLGTDEATGIKVGTDDDHDDELTIVTDSTAWPNERITLDLDTAEAVALDILAKVKAKR
jgi:hypothetical protein